MTLSQVMTHKADLPYLIDLFCFENWDDFTRWAGDYEGEDHKVDYLRYRAADWSSFLDHLFNDTLKA